MVSPQYQTSVCCSAVPSYTECRQVVASEGLQIRERPCKDAPLLGTTIPRCERFTYFAAARPQVSECAVDLDWSCWIEVMYKGVRGWVPSGTGTLCNGEDPTAAAFVAYCPANACGAKGVLALLGSLFGSLAHLGSFYAS
jgi:hypothetical protein